MYGERKFRKEKGRQLWATRLDPAHSAGQVLNSIFSFLPPPPPGSASAEGRLTPAGVVPALRSLGQQADSGLW